MHKYTDTGYMKLICDTLDEIDIHSLYLIANTNA